MALLLSGYTADIFFLSKHMFAGNDKRSSSEGTSENIRYLVIFMKKNENKYTSAVRSTKKGV